MRCVLDPGDTIIDCPPTFTMYVFDAAVNNAQFVTVPRLSNFRVDVPGEYCKSTAKVTFSPQMGNMPVYWHGNLWPVIPSVMCWQLHD